MEDVYTCVREALEGILLQGLAVNRQDFQKLFARLSCKSGSLTASPALYCLMLQTSLIVRFDKRLAVVMNKHVTWSYGPHVSRERCNALSIILLYGTKHLMDFQVQFAGYLKVTVQNLHNETYSLC